MSCYADFSEEDRLVGAPVRLPSRAEAAKGSPYRPTHI